jgi:hypothetical protein
MSSEHTLATLPPAIPTLEVVEPKSYASKRRSEYLRYLQSQR